MILRARGILGPALVLVLAPPLLATDGDDERVSELERKVEILAEELERLRMGEVSPPLGDRHSGLGPAASKIYSIAEGLSIGGYGEALYQNSTGDSKSDELDFLRAILYVGYRFTDQWILNTEIEIEHADEIFLEFATLDYLHRRELNFRAGLVLLPMGFLNELHEPTTFYSARRPDVETFILPSTWRENGVGIFGECEDFSYRLYVTNGFDGTDFKSSSGLRGGRQKGSKTEADDFAAVGRVDYAGFEGVTVGGSLYHGDSGQDAGVDGTVTIAETHAELSTRGLRVRGLVTVAEVDDVVGLAAAAATPLVGAEAIGEKLTGFYAEVGYDLLANTDSEQNLIPFVRYEKYDLQRDVPTPFVNNGDRDVDLVTFGIAWQPMANVIFKIDYQDYETKGATIPDQLNIAAGYVF